jgi:hypothetical protein
MRGCWELAADWLPADFDADARVLLEESNLDPDAESLSDRWDYEDYEYAPDYDYDSG